MPTEKEIAEFTALKTHADKVEYFAAHPSLARIFNPTMFSRDTLPAVVAAPVTSATTK